MKVVINIHTSALGIQVLVSSQKKDMKVRRNGGEIEALLTGSKKEQSDSRTNSVRTLKTDY